MGSYFTIAFGIGAAAMSFGQFMNSRLVGRFGLRPLSHGAVIVLQEIFGLNAHVREVAGRFAAAGFVALAPFVPMGRPMKEYVCVPRERTTDAAYLRRWFQRAHNYAATLPPKAHKVAKPASRPKAKTRLKSAK